MLQAVPSLAFCGFLTDWARLSTKAKVNKLEPQLRDDNSCAVRAWLLVATLLRARLNSMAWHRSWPGRLAVFSTDSHPAKAAALLDLQLDWQAFCKAKELSPKDPIPTQVGGEEPLLLLCHGRGSPGGVWGPPCPKPKP